MTHRNDNKIYKAALYCRLSKDDDDRNGDSSSIQTQKSLLERFCRENGYLIHDFYVDDGYSGLSFDRPDFQRLLTDIDNGTVNMVITKDLSRLGRDYIQTGYYTEIYFAKKRVRYIAVNDAFDSNRDDNDIAPFRHILNDMYAKDLSRKVKSAKRQRALNGLFISSQAPFGYMPCPDNHNLLIVDEPAAEIVRRIFALSLSGYSAKKIAEILTAEGVITPGVYKYQQGDTRFARYLKDSKSRWCYETVQTILKDRVYIGDMVNHKAEVANYKTKQRVMLPQSERIVVEDTHQAIIDRGDWLTVQQLVHARHKAPRHNFENIFRGMVFCADCGSRLCMGTKQRNGKYYHHYRCNNHYLNPDKCPKPHQISYTVLYQNILERIQQLTKAVENDEEFYTLVQIKTADNLPSDSALKERYSIEKRMAELSGKVRKLFDGHADGVIDNRNYEMLMKDIQAEQETLELKLSALQSKISQQHNTAISIEQFRETVRDCLNVTELTPFVLNKLISRIEIGCLETVDGQKQQKVSVEWKIESIY